ncbi:MAG: hypothetical protein GTO30_16350 [Acidobacteria bacterium]|nr:hypothetical protein [Acidobacteriota bacterium]NIM63147.1 hypothetical protein [Acidobacteriota bacterium]NIQ86468.1 hypothetical protein [Acidobacteriota bacterium]NIT10813.1 hypothetical protein [Acidobacteriota bacterium]
MNSNGLTRREDDAPVTVATFPTPFEAELARVTLESQGMTAVVGSDHGQYLSAAPWVRLQVPRRDHALATTILNEGPLGGTRVADARDDMRSLRLRRRFVIARWFLYASAAAWFAVGVFVLLPLFVVPLALAIWSRSQPRYAFGVAMVLQMVIAAAAISTSGVWGLTMVIPLIAFQFAWMSASPRYVEQLQASPLPETPSVAVGEAWKDGAADREPVEQSIWWVRTVTLLVATLIFLAFFYEALKV